MSKPTPARYLDHQGPVQAAAANDRDGGQPAEDGRPGLDRTGLHDAVPEAEDTRRADPVSARRRPLEPLDRQHRDQVPRRRLARAPQPRRAARHDPCRYSPELNPVERVWLYLRERFLSLRLLHSAQAIIDACCDASTRLVAEPDRIKSLFSYPWIMKVASWTRRYKPMARWADEPRQGQC